jgi:meso-butanediol dehydrogenase/(S,S)-butanediol dehydrogenase/diacetyl reductase
MISTQPLDLTDHPAVDQWLSAAVQRLGGIDILYDNASAAPFAPLAQMSAEDWAFTLRNELDIVFTVTRAAWPHLVRRGGGAIVNTASIQGLGLCRAKTRAAHLTRAHLPSTRRMRR